MTKEEKTAYYLDRASMPENLPYDTSDLMRELGISDDDISDYRQKLESELSLKPAEKRDILVKQVLKPLLKKSGFSTGGLDWRREAGDSCIIIHMQNSQFNSTVTGASFRFHIFAVPREKIKEKPSNLRMCGSACELMQFEMLPYHRMLSSYYAGGDMYKIDGYKNYLPSDMPVEDICRHIGEDFEKYILPELCAVKSYEDFLELYARMRKQQKEKEMRLVRYYYAAQSAALALLMSGSDSPHIEMLANLRKELELSAEDIASHIEWLDICRENSDFTKVDAKELAMSCV